MDDYQKLLELSREAKTLEGVMRLVEWDQETYMPKGAHSIRAEQLEVLSGLCHDMVTSEKFKSLLSHMIDLKTGEIKEKSLSDPKKASLKEWNRDFTKACALPKKFVQACAKLTSEAGHVWQQARAKSDFSLYEPYLVRLVEMAKEKAKYLGFEKKPYDGMLDDFEPGLTEKSVDEIFTPLKKNILNLLGKIKKAKEPDQSFIRGEFDKDKQMIFSKKVLSGMGYDFNHGRLDFSAHPFSTSFHPTDSRITTRMHTDNLMDCVLATIHEGGHALYEMGLPQQHFGSPLCESISLGVHESQSRFWETRIGQSLPFWRHFLPELQKLFPEKLKNVSVENFWKGINKVSPTLIRVEADEVTYSLHVILRFEIEKALFSGALQVKDIPAVWNQKMQDYLGITPSNDAEGCLQDVHWSFGAFGYFPTYTLGNLFAGHLFVPFKKNFPDWEERVARGDLVFIREWLKDKVHKHGRRYRSSELLQEVYKKEFSEKFYTDYLEEKYSKIYSI